MGGLNRRRDTKNIYETDCGHSIASALWFLLRNFFCAIKSPEAHRTDSTFGKNIPVQFVRHAGHARLVGEVRRIILFRSYLQLWPRIVFLARLTREEGMRDLDSTDLASD